MIILYVCWRLCKGTRQTFRNVFSFFDDKSCVTFLSEAGWKNCNNLCLLGPSMGNWHLSRPKQDETTAILFLISNCFMSKVCWDNCSNVSFRVKCGEVAVTLSKAVWHNCNNVNFYGQVWGNGLIPAQMLMLRLLLFFCSRVKINWPEKRTLSDWEREINSVPQVTPVSPTHPFARYIIVLYCRAE